MSAFILSSLLATTADFTGHLPGGKLEPEAIADESGVVAVAVSMDARTAEIPADESELAPVSFALADLTENRAAASDYQSALGAWQSSDDALSPLADSQAALPGRYNASVFWRESKAIPWRFWGATAAITLTGFANWSWGSSSFSFESEGWFGKNTASMGLDKLGHAWSTYVLTEFFVDGIDNRLGPSRSSLYTGALLAMGLMTYVEVFDGFSKDHGFSHEDLAADAAGALFSVVRRSVPGVREKVDFRLLYTPSRSTWRALAKCFPAPHCDRDGEVVRSPITDYSGQRYLFVFKLAGFGELNRTPLRLVELHTGYYARGFTREARDRGDPLRRRMFVGVGLNVSELLFPTRPRALGRAARSTLEYLQIPYTAVHTN